MSNKDEKAIAQYRLVGLSKPRSATLNFLHTDKEVFWAVIDMPEDRVKALWDYCQDDWSDPKIAEVSYDSLSEDGIPINAKVINVLLD